MKNLGGCLGNHLQQDKIVFYYRRLLVIIFYVLVGFL